MARYPSVPLITVDPYFSVWAPGDALHAATTVHWTGIEQPIVGIVSVDGKAYRFLGAGAEETLTQTDLALTPTASTYTLEGAGISLQVRFCTPLLLHDLELVSRPCSYMDFAVHTTDGKAHDVKIQVTFDQAHCCPPAQGDGDISHIGGVHHTPSYQAAWMGQTAQKPLGNNGDKTTMDWGQLYLAVPQKSGAETMVLREGGRSVLRGIVDLGSVTDSAKTYMIAAYDDVIAIQYFDLPAKAYWARDGKTILTAISEAVSEHDVLRNRCDIFDAQLTRDAVLTGGEDYAVICALAYRQTIAAHKLIADRDGEAVFLSKECYSNGCIGTVDVSYPSTPLYLLYQPELVKGMMRPVFKFARMPVWEYDFAPHDVGRYPYATGQAYGANDHCITATDGTRIQNGQMYPFYYQYPAGSDVYDFARQMPVEECGNMLVMAASVALITGDLEFVEEQMDLLEKWACYLMDYGSDPGEQLCTDDFAGHWAHNVNLAAKAIMGIASYALILEQLERFDEAEGFMLAAENMAKDWERRASAGDHTRLTFDKADGWSLKYNLVWDLLFETGLFSDALFKQEVAWYKKVQNKYGVPLDNRKDYTKSDWILWCVAMTESLEDRKALIAPIAKFLTETPDRVPFTDWYDTVTGVHYHFQNRTVQGGLYMPLLRGRMLGEIVEGNA